MMKVKCKTPFAKQAVICRTTHLGKPNKGNLFMNAQRQKIHRLQAALKKKKPTRLGMKERTLQEALTHFTTIIVEFSTTSVRISAQF